VFEVGLATKDEPYNSNILGSEIFEVAPVLRTAV